VTHELTITVVRSSSVRSASFTVNVTLIEEALTDENGNAIWDAGESYTDTNGNGVWDGKQGIFQKFWDEIHPRARWGLTKFKDQAASTLITVDACVPAAPPSSFYTTVQNATWADNSPLASGLYGAIQYYGFNSPYGTGYSGCANSDPINNVPCRKNFILALTSGSDVTGTAFADTTACTDSRPLVKNACVGYTTDLRDDRDNKQNVYTYIVNTMGSASNAVLEAAALAGGGKYYSATSYTELENSLIQAFEDILAQAASGTAVSVLTTSSRGIGSMIQAYFLPIRQDGDREVGWTGYTQNIWIDNKDNLREDTINDHKLHLDQDKVLRLFFDSETNETKAALFTTDDDGNIDNCTTPDIEPFSEVSYNWEGGKELALQNPGDRDLFTSKKEIRVTDAAGTTVTRTISVNDFTVSNVTGTTLLANALDADATYSAANIVRYALGECLETGVSGDTACGATLNGNFRDRRITIDGSKKVWKLGDIISSTPKVLSNSPQNTYHLDYGDNTYHQYITTTAYRDRVSLALVGANDGVLHAFRVGYLKDKNLTGGYKGEFQNASDDALNNQLGKEVWGYIPLNAFPYLKYLAYPDYCHLYFNDLSVRLVDASIGGDSDSPTDARVVGSWRTILLGGMRFGGGCEGGIPEPPLTDTGYSVYYALDVTDPLNPVPLWEFSDVDMGFSTSFPSVVRTGGKTTNGNWYVAVGTGSKRLPKSNVDIDRDSTGYIYLLDLKTGALVEKITLDHNAIVGDILAVDRDKDYNSETIYFGTSYYDTAESTWKGKLAKVDIPNQSLADAWTPEVTTLLTGNYPITASPDAAKDATGTVWVYGGTGKYFSDVDEGDATQHLMFGIKDASGIAYPVSAAADVADGGLVDQTTVTTEGTVTETTTACMHNPTSNQFENRTMVTAIAQTSAAVDVPTVGWKMSLSAGERVITRPLAVGGLVDFLTYMPSSDECSYGGDSYLYALDYIRGVAPSNIAIRTPDTTKDASGNIATSGAVIVAKGVKLGPGAPPTGEAIIVPPPKEGQEQLKKKIQIATGVIVEAENTPVISVVSKIVHWLKK
jgi:type IV pilus assembly protein PilY1